MKYLIIAFLSLFPMLIGTACDDPGFVSVNENENIDQTLNSMKPNVVIKVASKEFTATLADNATANAFKEMLPLTINMTELNGNEKFFQLSKNLPSRASNPGTINNGDILLWGRNTLVIFYETFSTSYSYTSIGKIDDPTGLASALGTGNVTVSIEVK